MERDEIFVRTQKFNSFVRIDRKGCFCFKGGERKATFFKAAREQPCLAIGLLTHEQEYLTGLLLQHLSLPLSLWMNWREKRKPFSSLCPPFTSLSLSPALTLSLPQSFTLCQSLNLKIVLQGCVCVFRSKAVWRLPHEAPRLGTTNVRPSYFFTVWCGPHPKLQPLLLLRLQPRRRPPRSGPTTFWPCRAFASLGVKRKRTLNWKNENAK